MLPVDRIAAYRRSLEAQPTPEQIQAQQQLKDEVMVQIFAEREARQKARINRFMQQVAEHNKHRGY